MLSLVYNLDYCCIVRVDEYWFVPFVPPKDSCYDYGIYFVMRWRLRLTVDWGNWTPEAVQGQPSAHRNNRWSILRVLHQLDVAGLSDLVIMEKEMPFHYERCCCRKHIFIACLSNVTLSWREGMVAAFNRISDMKDFPWGIIRMA